MKGGGSGGWGGRGEEEEEGGKLTKEMCGWLGKTWQQWSGVGEWVEAWISRCSHANIVNTV